MSRAPGGHIQTVAHAEWRFQLHLAMSGFERHYFGICQDGTMLDHLSIQCTNAQASAAFYDVVLAPLGGQRIMDFGEVIGYGVPPMPDFWIGPHVTGEGFRESHIAFSASDRTTVDSFFAVAVSAGAEVLHEPRVWPEYHPNYYGAFVRDPDGNNIEAVCHTP